jgi:hypothetical protein
VKFRRFLGRARTAANFAIGREPLQRRVTGYDDVWLVSYPKSGNTWIRFLIGNLVAGGETVDWTNIERRVPDIYLNRDYTLRGLRRPRYLKSHEPYRPEYRRVILVVRDPRDIAISYYHFALKSRWLTSADSMADFIDRFVGGHIDPYGSWGENVGSWLGARRGTANFCLVRYEDLLADAERERARLADALEIPADSSQIRRAVELSSADHLRRLEGEQRKQHKYLKGTRSDNAFIRVAKAGQWESELPAAAKERIESEWSTIMRELNYLP